MKKTKSLRLNKEVVRALDADRLGSVKGGVSGSCASAYPPCQDPSGAGDFESAR